ncbi:MAG: DsbC family protein [Sphaerotilus sp.]|nr:DsbC family protein [Sphaerotilus sp.]
MLLPLAACAQSTPPAAPATPAAPKTAAPQSAAVPPAAPASEPIAKDDPRVALAAKIPGASPGDLRATPVPGVYELAHGADVSYVTADATFIFAGDMYRITEDGNFPNLSELRRRELRLSLLAAVPESEKITFGPQDAAHTIEVFTDVDCAWCQKLHSQVAEYNKLGIRIRYLSYPRSGPDTESWFKADSVWCSADPRKALTESKQGAALKKANCPASPVARHFELGQTIGIEGTPGMVLDDGELIPGYISPPQLLQHLKDPERRIDPARSN